MEIQLSVVPLDLMCKCTISSEEEDITRAELLFNKFVVEHYLSLTVCDHAGDLFRQMFLDSKIATKFACASSKASIVTKCLAEDITNEVASKLQKQPLSLPTDGSNDGGEGQLYPIVVRYFDEDQGAVVTDLLTMTTCIGASTGK